MKERKRSQRPNINTRQPIPLIVILVIVCILADWPGPARADIVIRINDDKLAEDQQSKQQLMQQLNLLTEQEQQQQVGTTQLAQQLGASPGKARVLSNMAEKILQQGQAQRLAKFSGPPRPAGDGTANTNAQSSQTKSTKFLNNAVSSEPTIQDDADQQQNPEDSQQQLPQEGDKYVQAEEPKSIEVSMKLTDELRKKILEGGNASETISMNIPISEIANSTCNSTQCEGIIDAATKVVTGGADADGKTEQALNVTNELMKKAKPSAGIQDVPAKRKKMAPKAKPRRAQQQEDDDAPAGAEKGEKLAKGDHGVVRKKVKLHPVIPSLETAEPSSSPEEKDPKVFKNITLDKVKPATEVGVLNATNATLEAKAGAEGASAKSTDQIKELVKQEQNKLENEKNREKELIESQQGKPSSSPSVESEAHNDYASNVKQSVMKLKDYEVDKAPKEKPLERTPDPETLKLKRVKAPTKYKNEKEKKQTVKLKPPGGAAPAQPAAPKTESQPPKAPPLPPNSADKEILKPSQVTPPQGRETEGGASAAPAPQEQGKPPVASKERDKSSEGDLQAEANDAASNQQKEKESAPAQQKTEAPASGPPQTPATEPVQKNEKQEDKGGSAAGPAAQPKEAEKTAAGAPGEQPPAATPPSPAEPAQQPDEQQPQPVSEPAPAQPPPASPAGEQPSSAPPAPAPTEQQEKAASPSAAPDAAEPTSTTIDEGVQEMPKPPPKTASKEQKLKYLEALENNLKKTKEKIHKQKEKEQLKIGKKANANEGAAGDGAGDLSGGASSASPADPVIQPSDIDIKIKKMTPAKQQAKKITPEDIQIKIKKESPQEGAGANQTAPAVPEQPQATTADSGSLVDEAVKQIEHKKQMDELDKQIKKEKQEAAKAQAKKDAILKLLTPEKPQASKKKPDFKKNVTTEEDKNEDVDKRKMVEDIAGEIQQVNETKPQPEGMEPSVEASAPPAAPAEKVVGPKNPLGQEEREAESCDTKKEGEMEITGDEDIDENLLFHNRKLSQLKNKQQALQQKLSDKIKNDEQKRQSELEEELKAARMMENSQIQDQLDMQKKLAMNQEFKKLQDEEDLQENEALKAQMDLEIAQAQIQKKQLEQRKALLKAKHAKMMKNAQISQQSSQEKLIALKREHDLQQKEMKRKQLMQKQKEAEEAEQRKKAEEQAVAEAQRLAEEAEQKLLKQQEEEQLRIQNEQLEKEKEEKARQDRIAALQQKHQQRYKSLTKQIRQSVDQFSLNQKVFHLRNALALEQQIANDKEMSEAGFTAPELKVHSSEVFKNSFTFPQIALNDFAQQQLESLQNEEAKLNSNPGDNVAMNSFIKTAQYVAQQLSKHYGKQWVNPNQDAIAKPVPKVGKKKSLQQLEAPGLSLPQQFTSSGDFLPLDIAKESEKELLFSQRDLKVNAEVEQVVSQQLTPEEQEILSQSSIMTDDEQAKAQQMTVEVEDNQQALAEAESNPVPQAVTQVSQLALSSQELSPAEQPVVRQLPQEQQQQQLIAEAEQQPSEQEAAPILQPPAPTPAKQSALAEVAAPAPIAPAVQPEPKETLQQKPQKSTASSPAKPPKAAPQPTQSEAPSPQTLPDFQFKDIYGTIAQEDYFKADDIDEIVG